MKKIYTTLVAVFAIVHFSYAQWQDGANIYNTNSGNVGIGTTTPSAKLHIQADANTSGAPDNAQFYITGNSASGKRLSLAYNTSSNYGEIQSQAYSTVYTSLNLNPNGGNVGIGTTSPENKLDVNGVAAAPNLIANSGYASFYQSGGFARTAIGGLTSGSFAGWIQISDGAGSAIPLSLQPSGGNVGIGTTTPDEKLTVNGTIHSKEVKVDLSIYPDYVFKPAYRLPTLAYVKSYIAKNHHLPEMPTEAEVIKNGLNLGETNALLTKKVEELTLYLIQQDKQLANQQKINRSLQRQINKLAKKIQNKLS